MSVSEIKHVVIVPGLDGRIWGIDRATRHWEKRYGLVPHPVQILWKDGLEFAPKLAKIEAEYDRWSKEGETLLVGTSAGGVGVLNAGFDRDASKVVNICGFSVRGRGVGRYSFEARSASSPAFAEAIVRFGGVLPYMSADKLSKIMTIRARWDELVHPTATILPGATNIEAPWSEHIYTIARCLMGYPPLVDFLRSLSSLPLRWIDWTGAVWCR